MISAKEARVLSSVVASECEKISDCIRAACLQHKTQIVHSIEADRWSKDKLRTGIRHALADHGFMFEEIYSGEFVFLKIEWGL